MKENPLYFHSQRIKNKQFVKSGKAIISSSTIHPTSANSIKLLLPKYCPQLPNFLHNKSYDKLPIFDDPNAKQKIINILFDKCEEKDKILDIQMDKYEQLKKKYDKLKEKKCSKNVEKSKENQNLKCELSDVKNRYQVNIFCLYLFIIVVICNIYFCCLF